MPLSLIHYVRPRMENQYIRTRQQDIDGKLFSLLFSTVHLFQSQSLFLWERKKSQNVQLNSVRNNGSNVEFEECTDIVHTKCPSLDRFNLQKKNCKKDHQCTQLDRTFRCEDGKCWNITDVYSCTWQTKDPELNCENKRNCVDLEGMYDCRQGRCGQIHDWKCERRCADIQSPGKNVIIMSGKPSHKE